MNASSTIAIALCTYNGEKFLRQQLDSVLGQTRGDWEMVVVDDNSSDGTWPILQSYANADSRFRIFRNGTNLGYNRNFEKALLLCEREYIAICDQDDIWHPQKLEIQMKAIGNSRLIYHDSEFVDEDEKLIGFRMSDKFNLYRGSEASAFMFLNCVSGHSILMQRQVLLDAVPFPEGFHYDQWLAFVAADRGKVDFVTEPLVRYRQHLRNTTDILAKRKAKRSNAEKLVDLEKEHKWLTTCSAKACGSSRELALRLANLSGRRNRSFISLGYGLVIWQNRNVLLTLLKKSNTSKLFYVVRKIWGGKVKKLL